MASIFWFCAIQKIFLIWVFTQTVQHMIVWMLDKEIMPKLFNNDNCNLKGQSMTDFRSRFFSLKSLLTLGKYEWPQKKSSPVPVFFLGHSYFPSVSNDFSEKKRDLKSLMDCPFKWPQIFSFTILFLKPFTLIWKIDMC